MELTLRQHHGADRRPARAINDEMSASGAKSGIPPQGRDFRF
jgi:hypothetical protein